MDKLIVELEMAFENSKNNISFDAHNKTGYLRLVADGSQLAKSAQLLLLAGNGKTFKVRFYTNDCKKEGNEGVTEGQERKKIKGPKQKNQLRRRTVDA